MAEDMRVGTGFDIHRLVEGQPLVLGGVTIPFEKGLEGHSDGDALTHAIVDALLGAACLGDIGVHFPPSDEKHKGASSIDFLKHVMDLLDGKMFFVQNVDATIICEAPKLSPHYEAMRQNLSKAMRISMEQVSIKSKTMERIGPIGEGLAIACQAVALVESQM
ncbi:MAG TPA: 2-C-methyl-D-erythritol 2,4-cyclodiphosphate synthase [Candidatus Melainabacteria bacterium]|jgi:2-C-methyl-D-erythritol 2,4-cyclodiphosphate synthase|nr:2-C-methyl-D-erythritol 2,4-cyclodiphosphate synthase [Candidatus Melainabacteria bacterium]